MEIAETTSSVTTSSVSDNNSATAGRYHILDLRKMDLDKGANLTRLKIQPVPDDHTFRNKLAADQNLQEFIFINKKPGGQKLVVLLPKTMVLADTYTLRLPAVTSRTPALILSTPATKMVFDGNTPIESIPATKTGE